MPVSPPKNNDMSAMQPRSRPQLQSSGFKNSYSAMAETTSTKSTKSASDKPSTGAGVTKPKQSKSRNGCVTCKAKRLKCDEIKPTCQQCIKRGVECGGYKKDFKWRAFEETTSASKPAKTKAPKAITTDKRKRRGSSSATDSPAPPETSPTTTSLTKIAQSDATPPSPSANSFGNFGSHHSRLSSLQTRSFDLGGQDMINHYVPPVELPRASSVIIVPSEQNMASVSPRLQDLLLPGSDLNRSTPLPENLDYPLLDDSMQIPAVEFNLGVDEDIEEVDRSNLIPGSDWQIMPIVSTSPNTTYTSLMNIFRRPAVFVNSPEIIMSHYDKHTCGIMSVKDGPNENPWRTLIWPLAKEVPALYHAISSMTAFHMSRLRPDLRVEGMEHMRKSIRSLASGLGNSLSADAALATTLVLAFAESWDRHISTGIEHLRGAKILVKQALTRHRQQALHGEALQRLRFLYNVYVYLDVLARLTSDNEEDCMAPEPIYNLSPVVAEIDPLMGCATTLFPLIGQCATLVRQVRLSEKNTIKIIAQALELKEKIEEWKTESYFEAPEDPSADVTCCTRTAEAYRWATLLYLHQAVPEIASLTSHELAEKVLQLIASIPTSSRTCIVHIYPLLAAGCEAIGKEERDWVTERWKALEQRMWLGNVDRAWEVIEEVWNRRDAYYQAREDAELAANASFAFSDISSQVSTPLDDSEQFLNLLQSESPQPLGDGYGWELPSLGKPSRSITDDPRVTPPSTSRKHVIDEFGVGEPEYEMTIRGRLHWVGVMRDWQWEVLLG